MLQNDPKTITEAVKYVESYIGITNDSDASTFISKNINLKNEILKTWKLDWNEESPYDIPEIVEHFHQIRVYNPTDMSALILKCYYETIKM